MFKLFVGIYVLQDNKFRLLNQLSAGKQYLEHAPKVSSINNLNKLLWCIE